MKKKEIVYAFIDSQNLNLGLGNDVFKNGKLKYKGWKLDFRRLRVYLKEKYKVEKCFLFIGNIPGNRHLYKYLKDSGYILIFKPTLRIGKEKIKGNVDAELVLHTMIEIKNFQKAIIISGDGDFYCLVKYLKEKGKLGYLLIPNNFAYSSLYSVFKEDIRFLNDLNNKLGRK
ncbi:MAG: seg [candidate division WS6 bacterium GW2011_GWC1_36_11]|uniref:Seg n=3 Tax=Candidatus Dojkabacteria TaxID=74243 RepID=A0A0G0FWC2_9BACT|nr:MAG: seg [candidate division WS6 bacterium GW2011_GWC1_36_11]KKQ11833.1 MAG: hypothetical protein US24_C0013G0005 [candidate division WS6 bacterium GW2011_GWC2_36_7]KKQ16762.1 MAG: hypothetical protein US29_C0019G0010 [candidate division WS6 bacterium GW2011_GWF1_36_8]HAM37713.1 hypothetical protein [Patescibacteria group bacterium]HAM96607.1 hypothetical protein [Patescibacteria group bacterium]